METITGIYNRTRNNQFIYILIAALALALLSLWVNFLSMKVNDPDGFYHIRHAWLYRTNGIFDTSFPWTQYSVIKKYGGDLWYGFHLFMIPFTYFSDLIFGIKIASAVITWLALFLFFLALYRLKLKFALFWSLFLPFTSIYMLARLTVTRPHPISIGLNALLFSFLVQGGAWPVFIVSFLFSFIHLNLFWIPVITLVIISIGRLINKKSLEINKALALAGGIIAGAFLKPHPIAALKLNYIQLVDITLVKLQRINLDFGGELFPIDLKHFSYYLLPFVIIMTLFFVWLVYKKHLAKVSLENKIAMWTLLLLTMFFLLMTLFAAGRAMDFFASYFLLFTAYNITFYGDKMKEQLDKSGGKITKEIKHDMVKGGVVIIIIGIIIITSFINLGPYVYGLDTSDYSYRFQNSLNWLEHNTKQGDIVYNVGWDLFPEFFFWNQHNYYINGMDEIFMYEYNQKLFWEDHFISVGQGAEYTCGQRHCDKNTAVKTYDVLTDDFHASYILVYPPTELKLFEYLKANPDKYQRVFVGLNDVVYKIMSKPKTNKQ